MKFVKPLIVEKIRISRETVISSKCLIYLHAEEGKMKKVLAVNIIILLLMTGMFLGFHLRTSQAQAQESRSFSGVIPFATVGGFIGFFDQSDGTTYIYDDQLKKAVFVYKLNELGKPGIELE